MLISFGKHVCAVSAVCTTCKAFGIAHGLTQPCWFEIGSHHGPTSWVLLWWHCYENPCLVHPSRDCYEITMKSIVIQWFLLVFCEWFGEVIISNKRDANHENLRSNNRVLNWIPLQPLKTNVTLENQPFEDVSPTRNIKKWWCSIAS